MEKTLKIFIKGVCFSLVPAIFTLLGTINTLDKLQAGGYIGQAIEIDTLKNNCSIIGVFLTFALLTTNMIIHEMEEERYKKESKQLLKYNKDILISALSEYLGKEYCNIDIRIFVPHRTMYWRIMHHFKSDVPLEFCIKNIEGLAEVGLTGKLSFKVSPFGKEEGLVGECYQKRKMVYDDNLQQTNETQYNLTDYQISKTSDLKFIIVCPIFSKKAGSNGKMDIDAIVAFDCKHNISIDGHEDKFTNAVLSYTQQLYEYVPGLFKCKGGII